MTHPAYLKVKQCLQLILTVLEMQKTERHINGRNKEIVCAKLDHSAEVMLSLFTSWKRAVL